MPQTIEIALLTDVMHDAISLGVEGHLADGYTMLLLGLEQALEAEAAGVPEAPELVPRWRAACEAYAQTFGVPLA
jgi:hypothetical protein